MKDTSVASRYARALYLLTEHTSAKDGVPLVPRLEQTLEDLRGVAAIVAPGSRVGEFLAHPKVAPQDKRAVLEKGLAGKVLRTVQVFADLLLRKKRLTLAGHIAKDFQTLVEEAQGLKRAVVTSAVALSEAERTRLLSELERTTGKRIVLTSEVDPTLLGGAYVRIGDRIIDRSVKTLLASISEHLYEASV